jgi:hypothetical protein
MNATKDRQAVEKQTSITSPGMFRSRSWTPASEPCRHSSLLTVNRLPLSTDIRERTKPQPLHLTPPPLPKADADEAELRSALREAQRANAEAQRAAEEAKAVPDVTVSPLNGIP